MKREFTAVIKQDQGWWIGWGKEILGVYSQGKTKAELLKHLLQRHSLAKAFSRFAQ